MSATLTLEAPFASISSEGFRFTFKLVYASKTPQRGYSFIELTKNFDCFIPMSFIPTGVTLTLDNVTNGLLEALNKAHTVTLDFINNTNEPPSQKSYIFTNKSTLTLQKKPISDVTTNTNILVTMIKDLVFAPVKSAAGNIWEQGIVLHIDSYLIYNPPKPTVLQIMKNVDFMLPIALVPEDTPPGALDLKELVSIAQNILSVPYSTIPIAVPSVATGKSKPTQVQAKIDAKALAKVFKMISLNPSPIKDEEDDDE